MPTCASEPLEALLSDLKSIESPAQQIEQLKVNQHIFDSQTNSDIKKHYLLLFAKAYRQNGQFKESEALIDNVILLSQKNKSAAFLGQALYEKGMLFKEQGEYQKSLRLYQKAFVLFEANKMFKFQSMALRRLSFSFRSLGKFNKALQLVEQAKIIAENNQLTSELAHVFGGFSSIYSDLGLYQEALEFELKALEYIPVKTSSKSNQADSFYSIAEKSLGLKNFELAKEYFHKAYKIDLELANPNDIGHSQIKLSQAYLRNGQIEQAMSFAKLSLITFSTLKSERNIAWAKSNIGNAYLADKKYHLALEYLKPAEKILSRLAELTLLNRVKLAIGVSLLGLNRYKKAKQYLIAVLDFSQSNSTHMSKIEALTLLIKHSEKEQDFVQAFSYQKILSEAQFSYSNQLHSRRTSLLKNSLDSLNKDTELSLLEAKSLKQAVQLQQEINTRQLAIGSVIITLILLMGALYLLYSKRKLALLKQAILSESIERRNQLFADVSHELRTPLSVLKLQIQALEYNLISSKETTFAKLHEKISDLDLLIDDIYQIAQIDAKTLKLSLVECELEPIFRELITDFSAMAQQSQLAFEYQLCSFDYVLFKGDKRRLKQVLLNLLRNSLKYTDSPGEVLLSVKVQGLSLLITVEDSLPGVKDHDLERIFERLYRTESSRSRDSGGSGLGLTIASSIVKLHQGSISANHSKKGGLKVTIILPLIENYVD